MASPAHRIAFVTTELSPHFKVGGLGDVSAALPDALARLGHGVRVFCPLYDLATPSELGAVPVPEVRDVMVPIAERRDTFHLYRRPPADSGEPEIYYVQCAPFFERGGQIYTLHEDEHRRFVFFMLAVVESLQRMAWAPDVVHVNDWATSLLPLFLRTRYAWDGLFAATRSLLTIHNLGYQGIFGAHILGDLDLGSQIDQLDPLDLQRGRVNFLRTGLGHADALSTVSPTYAREIQTEEQGMDLHWLLQQRSDRLFGVLNGVDTEVWNPATDRHLPVRYSADTLWRKRRNKAALMQRLGLEQELDRPLFGMITRLVPQKGVDLLESILEELLAEHDLAVVVLGRGETRYESFLSVLSDRWPGRVAFSQAHDEGLAHLIEAGSDFFLMPSLYEPCGLNQMYSLLYGTTPVVHRTGGLADTVVSYDRRSGEGNGVVFDEPTPAALREAIEEALALFAEPEHLRRMVRNGMSERFDWEPRAESYAEIYGRLRAGI